MAPVKALGLPRVKNSKDKNYKTLTVRFAKTVRVLIFNPMNMTLFILLIFEKLISVFYVFARRALFPTACPEPFEGKQSQCSI